MASRVDVDTVPANITAGSSEVGRVDELSLAARAWVELRHEGLPNSSGATVLGGAARGRKVGRQRISAHVGVAAGLHGEVPAIVTVATWHSASAQVARVHQRGVDQQRLAGVVRADV